MQDDAVSAQRIGLVALLVALLLATVALRADPLHHDGGHAAARQMIAASASPRGR